VNVVAVVFVLETERQVWVIWEKIRRDCAYDLDLDLDLGLDPVQVKMRLAQEGGMEDLQRKAQPIQSDSL
jgi:hypothetical protein